MNLNHTKSSALTTHELIARIRTYLSYHEIQMREMLTQEPLLGSFSAQLLPADSDRVCFCGTGRTAANARAMAYLQCFTSLYTQSCPEDDSILCAGRSAAEACAEGLSSLLADRAAARLQDLSAAPEIPESVIGGYPEASRMYRLLKREYGDRIQIRDISGGGIQLTAALIFRDAVTFASHPDAGCALERLLVNAAHGSGFANAGYDSGENSGIYLQQMLQKLRRSGYEIRLKDCPAAGIPMIRIRLRQYSCIQLTGCRPVLQSQI